MPIDLTKFLFNTSALEADDITKVVKDQMAGNEPRGGVEPDDPDDGGSDDISNTNIIDAVQKDNESNVAEDSEDAEVDNNEEAIDDEESSDSDDDMGDDEGVEEMPEGEDTSEDSNNVKYLSKNILRDNLFVLYNISKSNIKSISNRSSAITHPDQIEALSKASNALNNICEAIDKMIATGMSKIDYADMLSKYIVMKNIFEVTVAMVEEVFKATEKEMISNKSVDKMKNKNKS